MTHLAIIGGKYNNKKQKLISYLSYIVDFIFISGDIINYILCNDDLLSEFKNNKAQIILPIDALLGYKPIILDESPIYTDNIKNKSSNLHVLDIGFQSINNLIDLIDKSSTIFLYGTLGIIENKFYKNSTELLFKILKNKSNYTHIFGNKTIKLYNIINNN